MPEIAESPAKEAINPSLRALFDIKIPDEPVKENNAVEELATEVAVKPPVEKETLKETAKPETKKDDITLRLAPDFAAAEFKPAVAAEEVSETPELDEAILHATGSKAKIDLSKFRDELKRARAELKSRPAPVQEDSGIKARAIQLEQENKDLLDRMERTDLYQSPNFQRDHVLPRQQKFLDAQEIVKESGGDPGALERAIALKGKARIDLLEEIANDIPQQMMRGRFERLIEAVDNDTRVINEKLEHSRENAAQMRVEERIRSEQSLVEIEGQMRSLLGSTRRDLAENMKLEVLQKVGKPEFAWWDEQVDSIDRVAEEILMKSTPEKAAFASYLAASAGAFREMWLAERKAGEALKQEILELKGSEPTLGQEHKTAKTDNTSSEPADIMARLQSGFYKS